MNWIDNHLRALAVAFTALNVLSAGVNFYFWSLTGKDYSLGVAVFNCMVAVYCGYVTVRYWRYV